MVTNAIRILRNHPFIYTMLWTNSWAIFTSYHASRIFDKDSWKNYRTYHQQSVAHFWCNNLIGHYVPILYLWHQRAIIQGSYSIPLALFAGFLTCSTHCAWTWLIHGGWAMKTYVQLSPKVWIRLWQVAIASHFLSGMLLSIIA
jgi:hypothetical protein